MTRKRALLMFMVGMVGLATATFNAWRCGYHTGWHKGYDKAAVVEALEWRKVPKQCGNGNGAGTPSAIQVARR